MKTEGRILVAFILNLFFAVFEFVGGIVTGSVAIMSDALHDAADAATIGLSYFLERKSKGKPDKNYTFGYARYSALGGFLTTLVLILGSGVMIYKAVYGIIGPRPIHYDGMIVFAIVGVCVNFLAAWMTHGEGSANRRAVNLHMLEDVLGWAVVLVGAIVMRFTDFTLLDPLMSIGVSVFILINAVRNLKCVLPMFLEKVPDGICVDDVRRKAEEIEGVVEAHHIHLWSMDGEHHHATLHVVTDRDATAVKHEIRHALEELGIGHVTLELEATTEECNEKQCHVHHHSGHHHHGHHHHHH